MTVEAILVSDIHLSLKPPRCRAGEDDWLEVQARYLKEVRDLQEKYDRPVLCAGDIFDKWDASSELLNFAIRHLPRMYSIPGNHDLPYHDLNMVHKSGYGVLELAGTIESMPVGIPVKISSTLTVTAFPWGVPIEPPKKAMPKGLQVALWHAYVWDDGASYPGAATDSHYTAFKDVFSKWDVVHLGDNHTYWKRKNVFNPGTFMRRKENDGRPRVGLLLSDGRVKPYALKSADADKIEISSVGSHTTDLKGLEHYLESLRSSEEFRADFKAEVMRYVKTNDIAQDVIDILLRTLGNADE